MVEKHKRRLWPFDFGDRFGRRRNLGVYGGLAGLAVAMGPIIGGAVTPKGIDWHWIFWINVPIGAVALPLATRLLPEKLWRAGAGRPVRRRTPHRRRRCRRLGPGSRGGWIAGAVSDRIGRQPVMATGLFLQAAGFVWVAVRGSLS